MNESERHDTGTQDERVRRINRSRFAEWAWYGALSLVLLLVSVAGFSMAAAVSPVFCSTCHRSAAAALAQSAHEGTSCDSCHRPAGALGLVENRLWVAGMVIEAPVRAVFPSGAEAKIDSDRCIDCHRKQMPITAVSNGISMNHAAPVKENWSCQRCHRDIAHGEDGEVAVVYTMGTCLSCHSTGPNNLSSCDVCHPQDERPSAKRLVPTSWQVTHGANWQQTHGMGDLQTCKSCHAEDYCVGCHEIVLPHPPAYLAVHGRDVAALGEDACTTCHRSDSCDACHGGVEMPHPSSFMKSHKKLVEKNGKESCERCHAESSCENCHSRHTHPGLTPERLRELRARPVNAQ